jgi:hypothetical protein
VLSLVPADGAVPDGQPVFTQSGTVVETAAVGTSAVTFDFPTAFPNGVLAVTVTVDNANGAAEVQLWQAFCTLSSAVVVVRASDGGSLAGQSIRLCFIAKGW